MLINTKPRGTVGRSYKRDLNGAEKQETSWAR